MNGKEITNVTDIASNLNSYFSNFGSNLAEKVGKASKKIK